MNTAEASNKWNCDVRDAREWCKDGKIQGARKENGKWAIPNDAKRPVDRKLQKELLWRIIELKNDSNSRIDLTNWGICDPDIQGYIAALIPLLIRNSRDGLIESVNDLQITEAGFRLLGRHTGREDIETPRVLLWVADTTGRFAGSFVRSFLIP